MAKLGWFVSGPVGRTEMTFRESVETTDTVPTILCAAQRRLPSADSIMSEENVWLRPVMFAMV